VKPRALIISYHFPPSVHVGARRAARLAKYLPRLGWEVWVLTLPAPPGEEAVLDFIPPERVIRISPQGQRPATGTLPESALEEGEIAGRRRGLLVRLKGLISRTLGMRRDELAWIKPATEAARRLVREQNIKVIFSTCSPFTCHITAWGVKQGEKIPWVADFRDPWAYNPWAPGNAPWQSYVRSRVEKRYLPGADYITLVTRPMRDFFLRHAPYLDPARVLVVSHGFDPEDFAASREIPTPPAEGRMIITHTGTLGGYRSPGIFFDALAQALDRGKLPKAKVEFRLVGLDARSEDGSLQEMVAAKGLGEVVKIMGAVPHREALAYQMNCDLLLYLQTRTEGGEIFASAKIYEYLGAGRPVLAVADESEGLRLLREAGITTEISPRQPQALIAALESLYSAWREGCLPYTPCRPVIAALEEPAPTGILSEILHKAIGEQA
jgi:glycosyltransferase involved in cell wall biosynthesis